MISIIKKSDIEISVVLKRARSIVINQLNSAIINAFPQNQNYLFEICGVAIEEFIEDVRSDKYLLKKDKKNKIIKDLPKIFLFSNYIEDKKVFDRYIGSFNEGYMYFYILKKEISNCDNIQNILKFIQENKLLTLEVDSDGDVLNLSCYSAEKIRLICLYLSGNQGQSGDGGLE